MATAKETLIADIAAILAKVVVVRKNVPAAAGSGPDYLTRIIAIEAALAALDTEVDGLTIS